jgi:signal transduction histidine kinase
VKASIEKKTFNQVLLHSIRQSDPDASLNALLEGSVGLSGASSGRLYRLQLEEFSYGVAAQVGRSDPGPKVDVKVLEPLSIPPRELLEKAIATRRPIRVSDIASNVMSRHHSENARSRLILPIVRAETCLGVLDFDSQAPDAFVADVGEQLEALSALALAILEEDSSFHLLKHLQEPIDYSKSIEDFLDAALRLAARASGMPFLAVRERQEDGSLRCMSLRGFGNAPDKSKWDFSAAEEHPSFVAALDGHTVVERDMRAPHLRKLRERAEIANVHSFVATPIKVGTETFGVLSFGAPCVYDYSTLEVAGFESIANGLGVAITNNRNFQLLQEDSFKYGQLAIQITAVEVAQAARHEARGIIDNAHSLMAVLTTLTRSPSRENVDKIRDSIPQVDDLLSRIEQSLDKIRAASQPPTRELQETSLRKLWEEAISFVRGRLDQERIEINVDGRDAEIEVYPDFLRHAFLNLLLNSIDAFKDKASAKGGRSIRVTIDPSGQARDAKIRYVDNATGIDRSRLKIPEDVDNEMSVQEIIFEPGVTSRPKGSGYGLYLVRKIFDDHKGSVNLTSHRNGVVFDIVLRKEHES